MKRPVQPIVEDHGLLRFEPNLIVRFLLETSKNDLNALRLMNFPQEDWDQFYQLIGYSLSGYGGLTFISDDAVARSHKAGRKVLAKKLKNKHKK